MKQTSPAKITCPDAGSAVRRQRLFHELDRASKRPLLWIASPAGSGKTTLVASYMREKKLPNIWYRCDEGDADPATFFYYMALAAKKANPRRRKPLPLLSPEYIPGLRTFTRRYFEELCGRLKPPFLIVLDNYQEIPVDSLFHEMLVQGLEAVSRGMNIAVISRGNPPAQYARLSANGKVSVIGWHHLRFTLEETATVIDADKRNKEPLGCAPSLYEKTDGWIAGIVLMLAEARLQEEDADCDVNIASEKIFDYFAGEIFDRTDRETRDFLLMTAFFPAIGVSLAEELTGGGRADRILSALSRSNYFTERLAGGQDYRYHPLFREFLVSRAKQEYGPERVRKIQLRAAALLEQRGRDEEAMELYAAAREAPAIVRLVLSRAAILNMQGRHGTLYAWLSLLPVRVIEADPWLLYWQGISCLGRDLRESRRFLEKAFGAFVASGDETGALYSWAGVVESISVLNDRYADLDPWIAWLDDRVGEDLSFPSAEIEALVVPQMIIALTVRQPDNPRISLWEHSTEALMRNPGFGTPRKIVFATYLAGHYFILGYYRLAGEVLREIRPLVSEERTPPLVFIRWQFAEAAYDAYKGLPQDCLAHVDGAFRIASKTGIHVLDALLLYIGAQGCIRPGWSADAGRFLGKLAALPYMPANILAEYHMASAGKALVDGDEQSASEHLKAASGLYERTGNRVYAAIGHAYSAMLLAEAGELQKAAGELLEANQQKVLRIPAAGFAVLMAEAYVFFSSGNEEAGHERVKSFLTLAREHGVVPFPYCPRKAQAVLFARALEARLETEYVKELIRRCDLQPDTSLATPEEWPWPLRIRTLGSFQISRYGVPMEFRGKTPKKPLELLRALIAFGGRNVPVEKIIDVLWPDADGDLAQQSFESALSRLRKLLGEEDCVRSGDRQLSLDPQRCLIDSLALETVLDELEDPRNAPNVDAFRRAAGLYKGDFLPADAGCEWAVSRSETLKSRLMLAIRKTGRHYEKSRQWEDAANCWQKGLDIDSLTEEFYRRLMVCYGKLGRRAEAVQLYNRCRSMLKTLLGVSPSPETEAVYVSLID